MLHLLLSTQLFFPLVLCATLSRRDNALQNENSHAIVADKIWQPAVASKFQIILESSAVRGIRPETEGAEIFDVDLFDTSKDLIQRFHTNGKKVICYFSAGGSETWRPDYSSFNESEKGDLMKNWRREQWLDIRSPNVFNVMAKRIKMASDKGCDGIDPDNIDAFGDESRKGGGFPVPLTNKDAIEYVKKLAAEARKYSLAIGLKNAEAILPSLQNEVQFAVNEECATYYGGCRAYESFLLAGKPVFHIEYAKARVVNGTAVELTPENESLGRMTTQELEAVYCLETGVGQRKWLTRDTGRKFSTVIKALELNKWVVYCDGTQIGLM